MAVWILTVAGFAAVTGSAACILAALAYRRARHARQAQDARDLDEIESRLRGMSASQRRMTRHWLPSLVAAAVGLWGLLREHKAIAASGVAAASVGGGIAVICVPAFGNSPEIISRPAATVTHTPPPHTVTATPPTRIKRPPPNPAPTPETEQTPRDLVTPEPPVPAPVDQPTRQPAAPDTTPPKQQDTPVQKPAPPVTPGEHAEDVAEDLGEED